MMQSKPEGSGTYTYSSQPRALSERKKYRDQTEYGNIMYDRRIVRGNTYALHTLPASSQPDPLELQRQQESRRRAVARRRAREQLRPRSPEAVEGRRHVDVQTELYLEEITDRVEEADVTTQTDAFLDRPPTPLFVPAKTGVDVATQIEEGELFNFDLEVHPILEVLVGKTVEQALLEVMEEEELASLRAQQRLFEENRNAEMVETQRLEEQERRRREEKERRMQQQREALMNEKETAKKIAASAFAQTYLNELVYSVFENLSEGGFFYDPVEREVETVFMPWLMDETDRSLDRMMMGRILMDSLIQDLVMRRYGITPPEPVSSPQMPAEQEEIEPTAESEKEVEKVAEGSAAPEAAEGVAEPEPLGEAAAVPEEKVEEDGGETKLEESGAEPGTDSGDKLSADDSKRETEEAEMGQAEVKNSEQAEPPADGGSGGTEEQPAEGVPEQPQETEEKESRDRKSVV